MDKTTVSALVVAILSSGFIGAILTFYLSKKKLPADLESIRVATADVAVRIAKEQMQSVVSEVRQLREREQDRDAELQEIRIICRNVLHLLITLRSTCDHIDSELLETTIAGIRRVL